jgi:hypothetical protein
MKIAPLFRENTMKERMHFNIVCAAVLFAGQGTFCFPQALDYAAPATISR